MEFTARLIQLKISALWRHGVTVIASQRVSRECAPDDRLREAIQLLQSGLDCVVAAAPRNGDVPGLDRSNKSFYSRLRQGGAALIGIFVFIILHLGPASSGEIKLSAKTSLPAHPVPVSIENVTNANDLFGVRSSASSQNCSGENGIERQPDTVHPAWDVNRRRDFFMFKLNFARKHGGSGEVENMTSNARHLGIGITGIDISETYRDSLVVGHTPGESQAVDGNFWSMSRDEFFAGEAKLVFGGSPQIVGGTFQRERISGDKGSRDSSYKCADDIQMHSDFAERERNYVVTGAVFCGLLSAFFAYFAYLIMRGRI